MHLNSCARESCSLPVKKNASRFCSVSCQQRFLYEEYIEKWLAGDVDGSRAGGSCPSKHVLRYQMERSGFRCSVCGWKDQNPHSGRIPLQIDHIDGNASNNPPENLRVLCPNHHALTETYAGANRGKGRPLRRARYIKGLKFPPIFETETA